MATPEHPPAPKYASLAVCSHAFKFGVQLLTAQEMRRDWRISFVRMIGIVSSRPATGYSYSYTPARVVYWL